MEEKRGAAEWHAVLHGKSRRISEKIPTRRGVRWRLHHETNFGFSIVWTEKVRYDDKTNGLHSGTGANPEL